MGEYAIGQPVTRFEDPRLLRGGGRYTDDRSAPNQAHCYILRAAHAHAVIKSIDTAAAKSAPGVLAVLTGEDWAASGLPDLPVGNGKFKRPNGEPIYRPPFPGLTRDKVRFAGDYVALVIAETIAQAQDAAELIEIDYDALPVVVGTEDAIKPGAPLVWPDCPDNICFKTSFGNKEATDAAFAKAAHVITHKLVVNRVTAAAMEPRSCLAIYDRSEDHYTLYSQVQGAHTTKASIARGLKVPESSVRVIAGDVGGSFGMKSAIYHEMVLSCWASKVTNRPVKWASTRAEAFLADAQGRDCVSTASLALDADHKFLALRLDNVCAVGAYLQNGGQNPLVGNIGGVSGVYTFEAVHVDVTAVFTNTTYLRPYRGAGRPEACFIIERIIDIAADELGLDPAELRRRNLIPKEAMPYKTAFLFTFDSGDFAKNMDMAMDMSGYAGFEKRREEAKKRGKLRGIGIANSIEKASGPGVESAEIRFDRAGSVTVLSGSVSGGQGHETMYTQMVCDQLGVAPEDVQYIAGDTEAVFFGHGSGGSRSATVGGAAMTMAGGKILEKAKAIAAHLLGVDEVTFADGVFRGPGTNETLTMKEVAKAASQPARLPKGMEPGLIASAIFTNTKTTFPNGTHVCEVEVDPDTGEVEIVKYSVVDDVGTVINPITLAGQIKGGIVQGLGQILKEDIKYDPETGQLLTASFMDYAMPRALDVSMIDFAPNPIPTPVNPLGSKGAGEAGCVGAMPTVANAVMDALSPLGIRHLDMPLTPDKIWRAINDTRAR
jgi:carbon-monoxide dehydrogenase large subunit